MHVLTVLVFSFPQEILNITDIRCNSAEVFQERFSLWQVEMRSGTFPQKRRPAVTNMDVPHRSRGQELCTHTVLHTVVLQFRRECRAHKVTRTKRTRTQQQGCVTFLWQCCSEGKCNQTAPVLHHRKKSRKFPSASSASSDLCLQTSQSEWWTHVR